MSRLALYRKWRPMTFSDVVEQRHVVDTLRNSVIKDIVGHAYLFSGTRGTGKTTMAKIFSRAINCLKPEKGDPCNSCTNCKGILDGSILDVIEMDAASNNGVDNIRGINDEVAYSPAITKYKVYIIDEVHMLSTGAFNALLKTLEEPPSHIVFLLATTEPQKLPATVLSRCQRFDFKRITEVGIAARLGEIADDCGLLVSDAALKLLARLSGGAMRDAISLLDQLTASGQKNVGVNEINDLAGFASTANISRLAGTLLSGDIASAWRLLDELMRDGRDLSQLCVQLIAWFRDVLLMKLGGEKSPLLDVHEDDLSLVREAASALDIMTLTEWMKTLSEHELLLRRTDNPRIMMEVLILCLCTRATGKGRAFSFTQPRTLLPNEAKTEPSKVEQRAAIDRAMPNFFSQDVKVDKEEPLSDFSSDLDRDCTESKMQGDTSNDILYDHQNETEADVSSDVKSHSPEESAAETLSQVKQEYIADNKAASEKPERNTVPEAGKQGGRHKSDLKELALWNKIKEEVRSIVIADSTGSMKLFLYLGETQCFQVGDEQLRVVLPTEDFLMKKTLSLPENIEIIQRAVKAVTGSDWKIKVIDANEFGKLKPKEANTKKNQGEALLVVESSSDDIKEETKVQPAIHADEDESLNKLLRFGLEKGVSIEIK